jgi:hypothetical protein
MIKMIAVNMAMTIKIPTLIPTLKMPLMASQLENDTNTIKSTHILVNLFCIISCFFNVLDTKISFKTKV